MFSSFGAECVSTEMIERTDLSGPLLSLQILATLEGKVVIGHSVYNDFEVLDINHPPHMVRDTSMSPLLSQLAGFSCKRSLKVLTSKLLNRKIQVSLSWL